MHRLAPEQFVIGGENPAMFEALRADLEAEFSPQSAAEHELVLGAALQLWRLRRASVFESAVIEAYRAESAQADPAYRERYFRVFREVYEPILRKSYEKCFSRETMKLIDAPRPEAEKRAVRTQLQAPPNRTNFSFVQATAFQDALCKLARYEHQLTEALSRTLRLLPRTRTKSKRKNNSGAAKFVPPISPKRIVIGGEDVQQFENLRADLEAQLKPQTTAERELVERIVGLSWRLRRLPAFEAALLEAARAEFKPDKAAFRLWAVDGPNNPLLGYPSFRDGKRVEVTAAEREAEWKRINAQQKKVEAKVQEILGDEGRDVLPDRWFIRERDIQDRLVKLARYEAALAKQLAHTQKLLHFLQASRMAAEDDEPN